MSDPTSRPVTASHPTRQQLDDLEALMQRMLALPVNQSDDDGAAAGAATSVIGAVVVEPPPQTLALPPELKEPAVPEPVKPTPPRVPEPSVDLPPVDYHRVQAAAVDYRRVETLAVESSKPAAPRIPERIELPPVDYRRVQASVVDYRRAETPAAESPKPAPSRTPEPRVDLHPVEQRQAQTSEVDYHRVETPTVDYRRLEVAPVTLPRGEMPKPDYRVPDVTPLHIPDVSPVPPSLAPSTVPPPKAVETPGGRNGTDSPHEPQPTRNGKESLVPKESFVQPLLHRSVQPIPPRPAPLLRRKPTRAFRRPIAGMLLAPVIWSNLAFDRWVGRFGRLGRWFRTPAGRMLVGCLGLTFLSAAIAWVVINGMGWTH